MCLFSFFCIHLVNDVPIAVMLITCLENADKLWKTAQLIWAVNLDYHGKLTGDKEIYKILFEKAV